jgi:mycothiol synthase
MTTIDTLPKNLLVRHPTMDNLSAVYDLLAICSLAEFGDTEFTLEEFRIFWQSPGFNLETDAWIVTQLDGRIVGYADTEHQEHARLYSFVRTHPEYCGQGIATHLLRLVEVHALEHIPLAAPDARVALFSWVYHGNEAARQLLEKHGYAHIRSSWRMETELEDVPPRPQWHEGITVRTFIPGQDDRMVFDAVDEAFQDHWGHMAGNFEEWQNWRLNRENFDPSLWFLAFEGTEIAGCSLCRYIQEDIGWVDTLAVRRPWRRKGLGMALLLHTFSEFYRRGTRTVGLSVDSQNLTGATRLYGRAGMHVTRQFDTYEKELRAGNELSTQSIEE